MYVSEYGNNRLSIFDINGCFIHYSGKKGSGEGEFKCPFSITIDSLGNLYVSDTCNNRLVVVEQSLKVGRQQQILREKQNMVQVMTTVNQDVNPVVFQPIEEANITFTRNQTLVDRYEGIGELTSKTFGNSVVIKNTCYVGKKSTVAVNLQTHDGSPLSVPLSLISCELSSPYSRQPKHTQHLSLIHI